MIRLVSRWLTLLLLATGVTAADDRPDDRSSFLEDYAATYRFRLGRPSSIVPTPDADAVLFLRSGPRSFVRDLYQLDLSSGRESVLLTAQQILEGAEERLTAEERARRERQRLAARGITSFDLSRDGKTILVPLSGRLFVVDRSSGKVRELFGAGGYPIDPQLSPDGTRVACVRDGDLYAIELATGTQTRLTDDAGGSVTNGLAEFVAQEEMSRDHGFWWSPDSRRIAYQKTDTAGLEIMNIMDATHPEIAPASWPYPRPGKQNASVRLGIVAASGGPTTWVEWDRDGFEYLAGVSWTRNAPLTVLLQNRRQTEARLLAVDTATGATRTLLTERDEAWVEIDETSPRWLPDGAAFLWTTERRGRVEVELRDASGSLERILTPPDLGVRRALAYLPSTGEVVVSASADPTEVQLYRVRLDPQSGPPRRITDEGGLHAAYFNRTGTLWVQVSESLSGEMRWRVVGPDGPTGHELRSVAAALPFRPRIELTTVGSDPVLHALLIRPRDFSEDATYPVIVHVYGGPTSQMVRASGQKYLLDQWIADHGYVVVAIDGRGTPGRGPNWQRAVKNNLIDVPLEDQARGVELLGQRYPQLDLNRVGIYGWSFGGYVAAMAVMRRPDRFHAGVAGAPVVDWHDYDTHYTERYMDLPQRNADGYAAANVLTYAGQLEQPLLLIHGTDDDNVYFMHSLKLADALFREGKEFEFLPLAGFTHMVPDPLVTRRLYSRIMHFFERALSAAESEPRDQSEPR